MGEGSGKDVLSIEVAVGGTSLIGVEELVSVGETVIGDVSLPWHAGIESKKPRSRPMLKSRTMLTTM